MIEVQQTILVGDRDGVPGNCLQAAIASVLDLPLDAVPHFVNFVWFDPAVELWARGRGLTVKRQGFPEKPAPSPEVIPDRPCLVSGKSERGFLHTVVGDHGQVVWDPHPSQAGILDVWEVEWFEEWKHDDTSCWACGAEYQRDGADNGGD